MVVSIAALTMTKPARRRPAKVLGKDAPSNKLNLVIIGAGGQGGYSLKNTKSENLVAIADVNKARAGNVIRNHPSAKAYTDFRVMFDKQEKDIDPVMVCTPDHNHHIAAMAAMERGKHVYCEKPLAHSVYEARRMSEAARKYKVQTQMGNQGHSSEHIRLVCEWITDGAIGDVREVHAWSNRPQDGYAFPSSLPRPTDTPRCLIRWTGICGSDLCCTGRWDRSCCCNHQAPGFRRGP